MPKKSTHWITIPEETLHTPASKSGKSKKGKKSGSVKNKLFWGVAFVVMAFAVFAALAPNQFNELLKGSLFDTSGLTEEEAGAPISILTLLPEEVGDEEGEGIEGEAEGEGEGEEETPPEEGAEGEAEDIFESEPVVQPEEEAVSIAVEPISEPEEVKVVDEEEIIEEAEDTQAKLIEELQKQLEEFQKQREEDIKAMEELAKTVEEGVKPAAPEGVLPGVITTTTIGQPPAVQPGFRVNTHTVTITPEEMLRRNMAGGYQVAQQPVIQPYQPMYQVTPEAVQTPDTGPSEVMFIAFLITFLGLLGWKLVRLSVA